MHHPALGHLAGSRCNALTQTIDIATTLLDLYGQPPPPENQGISLLDTVQGKATPREALIYGVFAYGQKIRNTCRPSPAPPRSRSGHLFGWSGPAADVGWRSSKQGSSAHNRPG